MTQHPEDSVELHGLQSILHRQIGFSATGLCISVCYSVIYFQRNSLFLGSLIKLLIANNNRGKEFQAEIRQDKVQPLGENMQVLSHQT